MLQRAFWHFRFYSHATQPQAPKSLRDLCDGQATHVVSVVASQVDNTIRLPDCGTHCGDGRGPALMVPFLGEGQRLRVESQEGWSHEEIFRSKFTFRRSAQNSPVSPHARVWRLSFLWRTSQRGRLVASGGFRVAASGSYIPTTRAKNGLVRRPIFVGEDPSPGSPSMRVGVLVCMPLCSSAAEALVSWYETLWGYSATVGSWGDGDGSRLEFNVRREW